jgi:hypothetical protein
MGADYSLALAGTAGVVAIVIALFVGLGRAARDVRMGTQVSAAAD